MKNKTDKKDMRYKKNERSIREAFLMLIQEKKFEKITVTELAKKAEINKGTFYLHYTDIYDLYNELLREAINEATDNISFFGEFFSEPEVFVRKFILYSNEEMGFVDKAIFRRNSYSETVIPKLMIQSLKNCIWKENKIARTSTVEAGLTYVFTGLSCFTREKYTDDDELQIAVKLATENIKMLIEEGKK